MNIGNSLLLLALVSSLLASLFFILSDRNIKNLNRASILTLVAFLCAVTATAFLVYLQITHQFNYQVVYEHTATDLATPYLFSALWAGQAGSFLLWSMINSIVVYLFVHQIGSEKGPAQRMACTCLALINAGLILMTWFSQPFAILSSPQTNGLGLNQALQDPWMVVHPPLVFIAYSCMAILFVMSIGSSRSQVNDRWNSILRRWTIASWLFLGLGIITGSLWAYRALGWGGYWAWDPIENAALVPWLLLTAIMHSSPNDHSRSAHVKYMLPFVLAVFGTVMARSGILQGTSVHAYTGSAMALPLFVGLGLLIVLMVTLVMMGKTKMAEGKARTGYTPLKMLRLWLYLFAGAVFLATICPLISGISIGRPFYNLLALGFAIACAGLFIYRQWMQAKLNIAWSMIITTIIIALFIMLLRYSQLGWLLVLAVILFPLVAKGLSLLSSHCAGKSFGTENIAAILAHFGLILLLAGALTSGAFAEQGTLLCKVGGMANIAGDQVSTKDLIDHSSTIIHAFGKDIILSAADDSAAKMGLSANEQVINYTTRPMIQLFWVGAFFILLGIGWSAKAKLMD